MSVDVKICGLSDRDMTLHAVGSGAACVGFVHFPPSPRHLDVASLTALAAVAPSSVRRVAVVVDAPDDLLAALLAPGSIDVLQLHGSESVERVAHVRARFGCQVWRAVGVRTSADLRAARAYEGVADLLLFDAKPPKPAPGQTALPGGNGIRFDWRLLEAYSGPPWGLSGGLDASTVGDALRAARPDLLDVSSGVETAPGKKSRALISAFMDAVAAFPGRSAR